MRDNIIVDVAEDLNVNRVGGRAVVSGHIVSNHVDIFAANERGPNFLYRNDEGNFVDIALEFNVQDVLQNGRGTSLADVLDRGSLDIVSFQLGRLFTESSLSTEKTHLLTLLHLSLGNHLKLGQ